MTHKGFKPIGLIYLGPSKRPLCPCWNRELSYNHHPFHNLKCLQITARAEQKAAAAASWWLFQRDYEMGVYYVDRDVAWISSERAFLNRMTWLFECINMRTLKYYLLTACSSGGNAPFALLCLRVLRYVKADLLLPDSCFASKSLWHSASVGICPSSREKNLWRRMILMFSNWGCRYHP